VTPPRSVRLQLEIAGVTSGIDPRRERGGYCMQTEWAFRFNDLELPKPCLPRPWDRAQIERGFGGDTVSGWHNLRDEFWKFCYFTSKDRRKEGNKFLTLLHRSPAEMRKEHLVMCQMSLFLLHESIPFPDNHNTGNKFMSCSCFTVPRADQGRSHHVPVVRF
jgi:hypothetical protein